MKTKIRAGILASTLLSLGLASPASAETVDLAPPFSNTYEFAYCDAGTSLYGIDLAEGECDAASTATKSGTLATSLSLTSAELPTSGSGDAYASIRTYHWLSDALVVVYRVEYTITDAYTTQESSELPYGSFAYADTDLNGSAQVIDGNAYASFYHELASAEESEDGTFVRTLVLSSDDGSPMSGPVRLAMGLESYASMSFSSGSVGTGAHVEVTSVTADVIA